MTRSRRTEVALMYGKESACLLAAACLLVPVAVRAEEAKADSLPGSSRADGLSLSPEAPPTPTAPGGRAPSFGAVADPDAWSFRISGGISAWAQVGIGRGSSTASSDDEKGAILHTPPLFVGKSPYYAGPSAALNFQYGSQTITSYVSIEAYAAQSEWQGYYRSEYGPRLKSAYVAINPAPLGALRFRFQVGAFPSNYGGPGQWGWGIFGPVLAVHGYGGTAAANYEMSSRTQLNFEYGISGVPQVDETFARGTYTDWSENALSTIVNHAHAGISYENKYFAKAHLAYADGRNFQTYLADDSATDAVETGKDGSMTVAALELRWIEDPYGQLGITPVYWDFNNAMSVHNGIWWGLDWTAGGREMSRKFLGANADGNGKIVAVSAEYDFSVSRMLHYPQPFDGNGRDLRVSLAFLPYWTIASDDPDYDGTNGYFLGASFEHVLLSWLSTNYHVFGESRDGASMNVTGKMDHGRWTAFSGTVGLALHSDWQSRDRIVLAYTRYFYSDFADNNPARPLDREVFTLGASVAF